MLEAAGAVRTINGTLLTSTLVTELVAVFPEGEKGMGTLWKDRYRLQRFGRGGFVKLALRTAHKAAKK